MKIRIMKRMESFSLIVVALLSAVAIALVLLFVAGVCSLCGVGSFGHIFLHGLWAMLLIPTIMIYGGLIERNIFRVKEVNVSSDKLPESFDGYRMGWNENIKLKSGSDSICVIGVQNISATRQFQSDGNLSKAMDGADAPFKILVSHDPTHWRAEVLGKQDISLMLSGHTHAMQVSIFGWCPSRYLFREYRGLYGEDTKYGTQYLYVNPGLGETIFPLRIGVFPEITVLNLQSIH